MVALATVTGFVVGLVVGVVDGRDVVVVVEVVGLVESAMSFQPLSGWPVDEVTGCDCRSETTFLFVCRLFTVIR